MNICVLIPAFNEEKAIGQIVSHVKKQGLDVIVVDDGSADQTSQKAGNAGAIVLRNDKNSGKGFSLQRGFDQVGQWGYDAVIIMDGDGQHAVEDLPTIIQEFERSRPGIVQGNRMGNPQGMPFVRLMTNHFMSWILSLMCHQRIPDSQCGYRLIRREVLKEIHLKSANFEIDSEILIQSSRKGYKIISVPVKTIYQNERSKVNPIFDTIRFFSFIMREIFDRQEASK